MTRPFRVVQLSDPHLGAAWGDGDPSAALIAAVDSVLRLPDPPDAVLVSGDIADHGSDQEYERALGSLERIRAPLYVLPGNHDDRAALRQNFGLPGDGAEPIQYAADLGPLRLVALDSTRPGEDPGRLDAARLGWLEAELGRAPGAPTLLALHHPPLRTGVPAWDETALPVAEAEALGAILERHPQVRRVVAGHLHRMLVSEIAGVSILVAPSTYLQAHLDFSATTFEMVPAPSGFAVHVLNEDRLVSHLQPVA